MDNKIPFSVREEIDEASTTSLEQGKPIDEEKYKKICDELDEALFLNKKFEEQNKFLKLEIEEQNRSKEQEKFHMYEELTKEFKKKLDEEIRNLCKNRPKSKLSDCTEEVISVIPKVYNQDYIPKVSANQFSHNKSFSSIGNLTSPKIFTGKRTEFSYEEQDNQPQYENEFNNMISKIRELELENSEIRGLLRKNAENQNKNDFASVYSESNRKLNFSSDSKKYSKNSKIFEYKNTVFLLEKEIELLKTRNSDLEDKLTEIRNREEDIHNLYKDNLEIVSCSSKKLYEIYAKKINSISEKEKEIIKLANNFHGVIEKQGSETFNYSE